MSEDTIGNKKEDAVVETPAPVQSEGTASEGGTATATEGGEVKVKKGKAVKLLPAGIVHVLASFNNTTCSVTDARGNVISWCSAGRAGFKGSRKSTAFAGTTVAQEAVRLAVGKGMHEVEIRVQGVGPGRESAVRAVAASGLSVTVIKDVTPVAHNGCRQRKRRRV